MDLETLKLEKEIKRNLLVDYRVDCRKIRISSVADRVRITGTVPTGRDLKAVQEDITSLCFPEAVEIRLTVEAGDSQLPEGSLKRTDRWYY